VVFLFEKIKILPNRRGYESLDRLNPRAKQKTRESKLSNIFNKQINSKKGCSKKKPHAWIFIPLLGNSITIKIRFYSRE
jgi:hypothetical protein